MEILLLILISGILLFFGISAFQSNSKSKTNLYFLLFITFVILWVFSNYFSNTVSDYKFVLLFNRIIFVSTSLLVWSLFLFSSFYPESKSVIRKNYRIISLGSTLLVVLLGFSDLIVSEVVVENGYSSIKFGVGILIYLIHFLVFLLLFIYLLIKKFKKSKGVEKVQLQYILLGVVFTAIGALITNLILPIFFNVFYLSAYGPAFLTIFVAFTFVSIVKHRLLGIRFLIGKILFFILLAVFTIIGFFFFGWLSQSFLGGVLSTKSVLLSFVIGPIYAYSFLKFSEYIKKVIEKRFVYVQFHPSEVLSNFMKLTSTQLDMDKIAVYVVNTVKKFLNLDKVGVLLFDKENSKVLYKKLIGFELTGVRDLLQVINYWKDIGQDPIIVLDEVKKIQQRDTKDKKNRMGRIIECMEKEKISAILPLNRKVQLNGILIIGRKKDYNPFSVEDMNFLEDIIANASVAMGRAILYKEVQNFNSVLKTKVAEQTKDLKNKVDQLNESRRKERDMVDIMGHELRTPMTVIRNYHELIEKLFEKSKIKDSTFLKKHEGYMNVIGGNIEKEISLINVLLSATKLDDGHMELNKEAVDVITLIEEGILGHESEAKEKGLYIKFVKPRNSLFPEVYGDKIRIHEILDNLISNAIKYTNVGGLEITLDSNKEFVKVVFSDTGIGIAEKDIKNVGKKFYRSDQYLTDNNEKVPLVRPGGTGLGLFVTFGLIKAHGGKIEISSKLGKGSVFTITLPVMKKEQSLIGNKKEEKKDMFERLGLNRKKV